MQHLPKASTLKYVEKLPALETKKELDEAWAEFCATPVPPTPTPVLKESPWVRSLIHQRTLSLKPTDPFEITMPK